MEQQERAGELGMNRSALCQGSPIQEQIRVRKREASRKEGGTEKREASRKEGGTEKDQEEGTSRPTLSVLKYEKQP